MMLVEVVGPHCSGLSSLWTERRTGCDESVAHESVSKGSRAFPWKRVPLSRKRCGNGAQPSLVVPGLTSAQEVEGEL